MKDARSIVDKHLVRFYVSFQDEKFNAKRLYEVSGIIAQTYRSMLEIEGDSITVKQSQPINIYIDEKSDDPEQFVKAMMKLSVQFPASLHIAAAIEAPDSIDAETLCLIRERFTDQIVSNEILWKKYPNPFVSHLVAVRNAGVENAYLHYILLLNNPAELKKWAVQHPIEWQLFAEWLGNYTPSFNGEYH